MTTNDNITEETGRLVIEATAWACAEVAVSQGATSWNPQGVVYPGDIDALEEALGREASRAELDYFREVFVGAVESEAKARS